MLIHVTNDTKFRKLCFNGHPRYTSTNVYITHTAFVFFLIFQNLFLLFFYMKKKSKIEKKQTKTCQSKHNIKLDWLKTIKQNTQVMQTKTRKGEREKKWQTHLEPFSFHTLEEPFLQVNPWTDGEEKELKPFKFERNVRALRRSQRGAKEDGNWFWFLDAIMPLLCWVANHL